MFKCAVTIVAVIVLASAALPAQEPAKTLAGRWEGQRQSEGRVDNVAVVFTLTDKGLTGEVLNNGQLFDKMSNIATAENSVTFSLADLDFKGVIDPKTTSMTLTASFQGRDLWSMTVTKSKS